MSPGSRIGPSSATEADPKKSIATDNNILRPAGVTRAIENADPWWMQGAQLAVAQLARRGVGFTSEHVVDLVGEPADPRHLGAAFAAMQRRGLIECCGARIGRDGRARRVWFGVRS